MPRCAFACMSSLAPQTGCETGDFPCYCNNSTNSELLESCVSANCTGAFGGFGGFGGGTNTATSGSEGSFFAQYICSNLQSQSPLSAGGSVPATVATLGTNDQAVVSSAPPSTVARMATSSINRIGSSPAATSSVGTAPVSSTIPPPTTSSIGNLGTTITSAPPQPLAGQQKSAAPIIGGTVGGVLGVICLAIIGIHLFRKRRRRRAELKRFAALQGSSGGGHGYTYAYGDVNGIAGTGVDDSSQSIWSGGPVVSFIMDERSREGRLQ
ncbi:hypothetical protein ABW21_db0208840 [Orbilia brochopaga]|nr:hypothetical protein ABW21_db0208840 [Drechslerella brochopaga]